VRVHMSAYVFLCVCMRVRMISRVMHVPSAAVRTWSSALFESNPLLKSNTMTLPVKCDAPSALWTTISAVSTSIAHLIVAICIAALGVENVSILEELPYYGWVLI